MTTREDLVSTILDDLNRTDMTAAASAAISNAISYYEKERWFFLEGEVTITSSASQVYYNLPSDMLDADSILVQSGGSKEPIPRVGFLDINEKDTGMIFGEAEEYCIYQDKLRFYPVANTTTFTIVMSYHKTLTTTASASNAWTNVAFDLIRYRADKEIMAVKLRDTQGATVMSQLEQDAYGQLRSIHNKKVSTGALTPTDW